MKSKLSIAFIFALIIALSAAGQAKADTLTYDLDFQFATFGNDPLGTSPWATAVFDDSFGGSDTVRLSMTVNSLAGSEYVSQWYFNFDPNLDASSLSFSATAAGTDVSAVQNGNPNLNWDITDVGTMNSNDINIGNDMWSADGDGDYDFVFNFPTSNASGGVYRLTSGETVTLDITYTGDDIDINSFNWFSGEGGGEGVYNTAAHVQSIIPSTAPNTTCADGTLIIDEFGNPVPDGTGGFKSCSGWIGNSGAGNIVPEPISSTLFIVGGTFLAGRRYFRRKK